MLMIEKLYSQLQTFFEEILPLMIVSGIVSFVDFLQRHYNIEPFSASKFCVGMFCDIVYGTLVGLAAKGFGQHTFVSWACAGTAVHFGIRRLEKLLTKYLDKRFGE